MCNSPEQRYHDFRPPGRRRAYELAGAEGDEHALAGDPAGHERVDDVVAAPRPGRSGGGSPASCPAGLRAPLLLVLEQAVLDLGRRVLEVAAPLHADAGDRGAVAHGVVVCVPVSAALDDSAGFRLEHSRGVLEPPPPAAQAGGARRRGQGRVAGAVRPVQRRPGSVSAGGDHVAVESPVLSADPRTVPDIRPHCANKWGVEYGPMPCQATNSVLSVLAVLVS